jgi:hypothetical protein
MLGCEGADPAAAVATIQNNREMLRALIWTHAGGGPRQTLDRPDGSRRSERRREFTLIALLVVWMRVYS